jgi:GWxTD domain-containing protein
MWKLFIGCFAFFFVNVSSSFAQNKKLKAFIEYKSYYSPEVGPYVDIQFQFIAYTINFIADSNDLKARIGASTVLINNKTLDTVYVNRYVLESPAMRDSIVEDFFDILRIPLQAGDYTASFTLADLNGDKKPIDGRIDVSVPNYTSSIGISDILIAEVASPSDKPSPFQKSGYDIIPRLSNFYTESSNNMPYYVELYNTQQLQDSSFGLRQQIISTKDNTPVAGFTRFIRFKAGEVVPMLRSIDMSKLYSGSYQLKLEIIDRSSKTVSNVASYYFERINENASDLTVENIILDPNFQKSITDDSLQYYLASLIPIARPAEVKSILKTLKAKSPDLARKHIQQFWIQTAASNAATEWMKYKRVVQLVEDNYATNFQAGFETDRGRVYLQYGPPNTITVRNMNPNEYPYEIWHYYKIKTFSNKRFVFYNTDLTDNSFRLLHSDMVGEQQNYKWQQMLTKRTQGAMDVDSQQGTDHYGGNSNYYYKQD